MKVNELMVGDWVEDGYKESQVTSITCDGIVETTTAISNIEVIDPIPLTEEILVKNGFKFKRHEFKTTNDDYWISDDKRIIFRGEHMTNSFNKWSVHVDTEDMRTMAYLEITYVHQLQHLLRLCDIEKEIEL